jgi:hypothetical protein
MFLESQYEKCIQGPGSLNLTEHQEFGAFFIANSSFERLSYLPGCWVSGSWVPGLQFLPKKNPPPYKIANAISTPIANGIQHALMISGKCGYHLMELPTFRAGPVFPGKGCKE